MTHEQAIERAAAAYFEHPELLGADAGPSQVELRRMRAAVAAYLAAMNETHVTADRLKAARDEANLYTALPIWPTIELPVDVMCEDCPPAGYPTDKTRCDPCSRRTDEGDINE